MIAQIAVFSRKTDAQRKKNFAFRSAKIAQKFRHRDGFAELGGVSAYQEAL